MTEGSDTPIQALVISSGTGDGSPNQQHVETPFGRPNVIITYIGPVLGIFARAVATFVGSVVGLLTAGSTTSIIPAHDFKDLLMKCAGLSIGVTVVGAAKDIAALFTWIGNKFPLLRA